ncbi:MAG TPA: glycosyltransferase family 39 protein [Chthoniobacter sp.]
MPPSDPNILSPAPATSGDHWWKLCLIAIVALLAFHFYRGMQRPWVEDDTWYGAVYSQAAHNNLRAGLHAAGVPATLYFGPLPIPPDAYYVHHPTLLPLLVTGSFAIVGEAEWSARLVPVLASLASVIVLWFLVRGAAGPRAGTLAAFVFAAVPMELHYGDMVDFEPVLTLWMLAILLCLQRWEMTANRRWAIASALFAALALWTDWPGYLLVLSVAASFIFARARERRWMGWMLGGLVGVAGLLFLVQIRWANAAAWSDLWSALQMRLGNAIPTSTGPIAADAQRFTWGDWSSTVLDDLRANYLVLTWLLVALGICWVIRRWRTDAGIRWLGWAAGQLFIADALYVVLLRNESFIHDFAPFYLLGAIGLLGGLGLEAICCAGEKLSRVPRLGTQIGVAALVVALGVVGFLRSEFLRTPFMILDGIQHEPPELIPKLGQTIDRAFPTGRTILANFDPYGSSLTYYAQRPMLTNLLTTDDWHWGIAAEHPAGGIIWLGAPGASEILAALPGGTTRVEVAGFDFALWHAPAAP